MSARVMRIRNEGTSATYLSFLIEMIFKALSKPKAQGLLFDTQSNDIIRCPLNTYENFIFQLVLMKLHFHMILSNKCTQEYILREKQNKMTCPKVSFKFPIWVWFSTLSFIYEIEKLLLFYTSSVPMSCLFLNADFASMYLKE